MSKILSNPTQKNTEKEIETMIARRLSFYVGGYVWQVELGGKPVKTKYGTRIVPFGGKYYRRGASDIMFFYKGLTFAFEVKTPLELGYIGRHLKSFYKTPTELITNKKKRHIKEQYDFIRGLRLSGSHGAFVCDFESVEIIIKKALLGEKYGLF